MVALSPKARLMPPLAMPILSRMLASSAGGIMLADLVFDLGEDRLGLLDARAFGRAHVHAHLARVDVGKEVLADEKGQAQRPEHEDAE